MGLATSTSWYRLHPLTIIALCLVVGAVTYEQTLGATYEQTLGSAGFRYHEKQYGWPIDHLSVRETQQVFGPPSPVRYEHHWRIMPLAINTLLSILLVASTIFVVERWMRRPKRWQFALGTYLAIVMTCGVLIVVLNGAIEGMLDPLWAMTYDGLTWNSLRLPIRWPLLFALGCAIYTLGGLGWRVVLLARHSLHRRSI